MSAIEKPNGSASAPLGLLTNAVQTLAGVLLPSATVFLLLLCNDRAVLGPWVNSRRLNLFTGTVIAVPVILSLILTLSVLYPAISEEDILEIVAGGGILAVVVIGVALVTQVRVYTRATQVSVAPARDAELHARRMPPLDKLPPVRLTLPASG